MRPRVLLHLARADFVERSRGYGFLIILCLSLYLGYAINMGQIVLRFNTCAEIFDSAWAGIIAAIAINFFLGFFGFYLVKGSIERDRRTGVGQIMAATPMQRIEYVFGKWLSHFMVLGALVIVLALTTVLIQSGRTDGLHPLSLLVPFLGLTLPFMALVAAAAVLFETLPGISGGLGNLLYFFLFVGLLVSVTSPARGQAGLLSEPSGIRILLQEIKSAGLDCGGAASLAELTDAPVPPVRFDGLAWDAHVTLSRLILFGIALALTAASGLLFDRFDRSASGAGHTRPRQAPAGSSDQAAEPARRPARLSPLATHVRQNNLPGLILAEVRLMLKGNHWLWYGGAAGIWLFSVMASTTYITLWLIIAALWPVLLWSKMGGRETYHRTNQIVFSSPHPLTRLLLAAWIAGVLVTMLLWSGAGLNFLLHGATTNLAALFVGALLVPAAALACGAWTGSSKVFEVVYLVAWYAGIANRLPDLDYLGLTPGAIALRYPPWLLAGVVICLALAFAGRRRRIRI
jgi:hypothetical protein